MKKIALKLWCSVFGHPKANAVWFHPPTRDEVIFGRTLTVLCRRCEGVRVRIEERGELALAA